MAIGKRKKRKANKQGRQGPWIDLAAGLIEQVNRFLPPSRRIQTFKRNRIARLKDILQEIDDARAALALKPESVANLERLSLALERMEHWDEAADLLASATPAPARIRIRPRDVDAKADEHLTLAIREISSRNWSAAAASLIRAADRTDQGRQLLFILLGSVLREAGSEEAARQAFRNAVAERAVKRICSREKPRSMEDLHNQTYSVYHRTAGQRPDMILYETFHGKSVSCNTAAMLRAALDNPRFRGFVHVLASVGSGSVPPELASREDVIVVGRNSNRFRRMLCEAGHLINNTTFPSFFIRRSFQKYLNTWHGTPMKTLGKFIPGKLGDHRNAQRNFLQATHILSQNPFTTDRIIQAHDIPECYRGLIAETGYPRVDVTVNATDATADEIKQRLGIPTDRKVIFFAPTWRGNLGDPEIEIGWTADALAALVTTGGGQNVVLYRGHHISKGAGQQRDVPWIVPCDTIDTNELLAITDVLVSDYSSIIFDFLPLGRPIILHAHDRKDYAASRGFFIEPETLGLSMSATLPELVEAVDGPTVPEKSLRSLYGGLEDGRSTDRAMAFFFDDDPTHVCERPKKRTSLLVFGGGLKKNGVTISLLARLANIDHTRYEVILVTMTSVLQADEDKLLHFSRLHPAVKIVDRGGKLTSTPLELVYNQRSEKNPNLPEALLDAFSHECDRTLGSLLDLDIAVDYGGYSRFWALFIARTKARRKLIYLHNDMIAERNMRFPDLDVVFSCYSHYDGFVSVTASSSEVNRASLAPFAGDRVDAFVHVPNPLDSEGILEMGASPLEPDLCPALATTRGMKFVNVARLSPEKGHRRLLDAFAKVRASQPDAGLFIVGDGPIRGELEDHARDLGLVDCVHFTGLLDNPLKVVNACDAFIFSSVHEGQGLALIEALILGKVSVSTDIPGPRDVLAGGLGLLVADSTEGIEEGMRACLEGWKPEVVFDPVRYNQEAEILFEKALLGNFRS
jgi:CDP-glycerol glycerophosphotransferase